MQMKALGAATRRVLAGAGITAITLAGIAVAVRVPATPVSALTNCTTNSAAMSDIEREVFDLINQERAQHGLGALKVSAALNRAAAWKSGDSSALPPHFSHTDSLGRLPDKPSQGNRATDCGYPTYALEIIAFGFDAPGVVEAWMNSSGHRANILDPSFRVAGVGFVGISWTVNFGAVDDSGVPGDPPPATSTPTQPGPPTIPQATATPTKTAPIATPTKTAPPAPTATPTQPPPQYQHAVNAGFNLVTYVGGARGSTAAFASMNGSLVAVYRWDPASDSWLKYVPGAPEWVSTLGALFNGDVLFIEAASNGTWSY